MKTKNAALKIVATASLMFVFTFGAFSYADASIGGLSFSPFSLVSSILGSIFGYPAQAAPAPVYNSSITTNTNTYTNINGSNNNVYNTYNYTYNNTYNYYNSGAGYGGGILGGLGGFLSRILPW